MSHAASSKSLVLLLALAVVTTSAFAANTFVDRTATVAPDLINGAAAWGDFDADGDPDLNAAGRLLRNEGGTNFTWIASPAQGLWGDYDNNGYLDWFGYTARILYQNNGGLDLVPVSFPTLPMGVTVGASWGDFNGDGYLDLYVGGFENPDYQPDAIVQNNRDGSFSVVWQETGAVKPARGVTSGDFDEDGDLDVYVSNYRLEANYLWQNDGTGGFADVASAFGVAGVDDGWSWSYGHTIGSCWGDLDNDGHFDLFVGNFSHPDAWQDRPKFYRNLGSTGAWHFEDMSATANLAWQESYASPVLFDYDNDGDLDLFFTTVYGGDYPVLYRNDGNWHFTDVTAEEGLAGLPPTYQAAVADFNNDGHLDLVTGGKLFVNQGNANHWLKVKLQGGLIDPTHRVNQSAIGAQVRIAVPGLGKITRQVEGGTGEGNQNDLTLHFGLGNYSGPVTLDISWPGGYTQTVTGVTVDQLTTVAVPATIIVDNADATGVTLVGSWAVGAPGGTYGPDQLHDGNAGKGSKSVRFSPTLPSGGSYQVYLWYTAIANRPNNVPVDIVHAAGTSTVTVNQQVTGSQWVLLGTYSFNAGTGGSVLIRTDGTSGYVIADAVRFVGGSGRGGTAPAAPSGLVATAVSSNQINLGWTDNATDETGFKIERGTNGTTYAEIGTVASNVTSYASGGLAAGTLYYYRVRATNGNGDSAYSAPASATTSGGPVTVIVDNADPTGVTTVGVWTVGAPGGTYGANQLHDGNTGKGTKSVRFTPTLPSGGTYQVYLWWTASGNRPANVPVDVVHAAGTATVTVNEQVNGSQWNLLGTYTFNAGTAGSVLIRTDGTSGYVIADAVRFVPQAGGSSATGVSSDAGLADLGGVALGGTARGGLELLLDGTAELRGSGAGFGETDDLYFAPVGVAGDFVAMARIQGLVSNGDSPLVGLMVREDLAADARFVALATSLGEHYQAVYRLTDAGLVRTELAQRYSYPDAWLALSRVGDDVVLYTSPDGVEWTEAEAVTVPDLTNALHVGLFLSSGTPSAPARATISEFTVTPLEGAGAP